MATLTLSRAVHDEMLAHVAGLWPEEACGLVGGRDGRAVRLYAVENTRHSPVAFEMDPLQQGQTHGPERQRLRRGVAHRMASQNRRASQQQCAVADKNVLPLVVGKRQPRGPRPQPGMQPGKGKIAQ